MGNVQECFLSVMRDNAAYAPEHGIIHVGAHRCEEKPFYEKELGVGVNNILWIDGNDELCKERPEIVNAIVADKDDQEVEFIITSNEAMSSSILELKEHLVEHPDCLETRRVRKRTVTLDTLIKACGDQKYDMLVMDVQGAELLVLRGAEKVLSGVKCVITEVNTKELYAGCAQIEELDAFLGERGFVRVCTDMTRHGWGDALYLRKLVTVQLSAGLGNRLFQLAFLYAIAKKTRRMPVLYDEFIEPCAGCYDAFYEMFPRYSGGCGMGLKVLQEDPNKPCVYVDYTSHEKSTSKSPVIKFKGWFQSPQFFQDYTVEIHWHYLKALELNPDIREATNFIHVRGGDFITIAKSTHCLPDIAGYYEKALEASKEQRKKTDKTVIITNDLKYVESFDVLQDFRVSQTDELDALKMMARCTGVAITANSTFSWWGAFLSEATEVYMPRPFLLGGLECRDVYFDDIKRIDAAEVGQADIFGNLLVVRRCGRRYLHVILVRHLDNTWFCDKEVMIDGWPVVEGVQFISQEHHGDIYSDVCIIKHDMYICDERHIMLTLNGVSRQIKIEEYEAPKAKYKLVAMTLFKDDIHLIEPYVRHHRKLGVEHFYLYYNGVGAVDKLPVFVDVTYLSWPHVYSFNGLHVAQLGAMTDMLAMAKHVAEYVLFSDLDEYLIWRARVSLCDFIAVNDGFKIYAFLNNFILLENPKGIGLQIDEGRYKKTLQMEFGKRSKCIVKASAVNVMGVHKPMKDVGEDDICVLAAPMCELLHVCNLQGRRNVSFAHNTSIGDIVKAADYIRKIC
jgi:FkbM family methyltransferase